MDNNQRFHPLDRLITDNSLFILEALVPFVEYPFKKPLVLFIKYRELSAIMKSLDDRTYISECGFDCHPGSTEDMISDMCNFLPNDFASSIRQMKQMMSMMEMMNMSGDINDMMKGFSFGANDFGQSDFGQDDFGQSESADGAVAETDGASHADLYESVMSILNQD